MLNNILHLLIILIKSWGVYISKREFRLETQEEIEQFRQVKNFENEIKNIGIIKHYQTIEEFRYMLFMELSICIKEEFIKSKGD